MMVFSATFFVGLLEHPILFVLCLIASLVAMAMLCALIHMTYDFFLRLFDRIQMPEFGGYFGQIDGEAGGGPEKDPVPDDGGTPDGQQQKGMEVDDNGNLVYENTCSHNFSPSEYYHLIKANPDNDDKTSGSN